MSRTIQLDKFYTPSNVAENCVEIMLNKLSNKFFITEFVEPSAGSGNFSNLIKDTIAYDIEPEGEGIIKEDFLKLDLPYKKGRVIFGNPPFGDRNNLARSFYKKSVEICDGIAFILPISQLNNRDSLYQFDLIESVDLGVLEYSGVKVSCCFNIYTRPKSGTLNKKPNFKLNTIKIYRDDQQGYENIDYDFAICRRGNIGSLRIDNLHTQTYKIKITDKSKLEEYKSRILNYNWDKYKKHQSSPSISKNDVYRVFI